MKFWWLTCWGLFQDIFVSAVVTSTELPCLTRGFQLFREYFCLFFFFYTKLLYHGTQTKTKPLSIGSVYFSFIHPVSSAWFLLKVRAQNISQVTAKFRQQVSPFEDLQRACYLWPFHRSLCNVMDALTSYWSFAF